MAILDETELRALARNISLMMSKGKQEFSEDELRQFVTLRESLFETTEQHRLHVKHLIAACNALCSFLDQGWSSRIPEVQIYCRSQTTWHRLLAMFLSRGHEHSTKPMRQVLTTLIKLLLRNKEETQEADAFKHSTLSGEATLKCLALLEANEDLSSIKPCMTVLEALLSKDLINSKTVISLLLSVQVQNKLHSSSFDQGVVRFIWAILRWMRHADVSLAGARLISSFFVSLRAFHTYNSSAKASPPLWASPVHDFAVESEATLEIAEVHILPNILRVDTADTRKFTSGLPFCELRNSDIGKVSEMDVRFCLIVAKIASGAELSAALDPMVYTKLNTEDLESAAEDESQAMAVVMELSTRERVASVCLTHPTSAIRNTALVVLVQNQVTSTPFSAATIQIMEGTLPLFYTESNNKARNEFLSTIKRLCLRLHDSIARLRKVAIGNRTSGLSTGLQSKLDLKALVSHDSLDDHINFVQRLFVFSCGELQATASYQRHIMSLNVLQLMHKTGLFNTLNFDSLSAGIFPLLQDCVMDSFDDVRCCAAKLLKDLLKDSSLHSASSYFGRSDHFHTGLSRAETLMRKTGRADLSDGYGRLCNLEFDRILLDQDPGNRPIGFIRSLLSALESEVILASNDVKRAVAEASIHGRLIALRYLIDNVAFRRLPWSVGRRDDETDWWSFQDRLLECCSQIWDVVKPILCVDSPEGQQDEEETELDIGIKDVLSFSWRALKEASSLMQSLVSTKPPDPYETRLEDLKLIGNLSFVQLAELRHRGAFSTVAQTFTACCMQCNSSEDAECNEIPKTWFKETLQCIQDKAEALTRRSAGLPAMVTSILAAFPQGEFFESVIAELQQTAQLPVEPQQTGSQIRLPQVHALNCLKEIFTTTRLGEGTESHVEAALGLAVNCLNHDVWAIRNCGIMFFKALIYRMTSGLSQASSSRQQNKRLSKSTYRKYPQLADIVEKLLEESCFWRQSESLVDQTSRQVHNAFPALEIIKRVGVEGSRLKKVETLLLQQLRSPIWTLRDKVARTFGNLINDRDMIFGMMELLEGSELDQNELHGRLLCLKYRYLSHPESRGASDTTILALPISGAEDAFTSAHLLATLFEPFALNNPCPFTAATYLESLAIILRTSLEERSSTTLLNAENNDDEDWQPKGNPKLPLQACLRDVQRGFLDKKFSLSQLHRHLLLENQDTVKRSLAKLFAFTEVFLLTSLTVVPTADRTPFVEELLGTHLALARLEALEAFEQSLSVDTTLIVMRKYLDVTLSRTADMEQALNYLASLLARAQSQKSIFTVARPALKLELIETGLKILDHPSIVSPKGPSVAQCALRAIGGILTILYFCGAFEHENVDPHFLAWTQTLYLHLDVNLEYSSRLAAVQSINSFQFALADMREDTKTPMQRLQIHCTIYNALNDDDVEIRDAAASIVSYLLSHDSRPAAYSSAISLSSAAALRSFQDYLPVTHAHSRAFILYGLARLVETSLITQLRLLKTSEPQMETVLYDSLNPPSDLLTKAAQQDTSLFVVEKQNLFIDDAQECERWSTMLSTLPASTVSSIDIAPLQRWASDGLDSLLAMIEEQPAGPLAWASKSEVFALGVRILEVARLIISWRDKLNSIVGGQKLQSKVNLLQKPHVKSKLHSLWIKKVGAISIEVESSDEAKLAA